MNYSIASWIINIYRNILYNFILGLSCYIKKRFPYKRKNIGANINQAYFVPMRKQPVYSSRITINNFRVLWCFWKCLEVSENF
jgi:hypothetical protein